MTDRSTPAARRESAERLTLDPSPSSPARPPGHPRPRGRLVAAGGGRRAARPGRLGAGHQRGPACPDPFTLTVELRDDHVRISVQDQLELISIELATPGAVARPTSSRLASLVDQLYGQFRNQRDGHRTVVAEAQARGERTVALKARISPASVEPARANVGLLEEADELCRRGELLTPPPPAQVRSLRRWFIEQMAAQLHDAAPSQPAG
jgi:hypothetical protein